MDFSLNEIQQDIANLAGQILRRASTPERLKALEAGGQRLDRQLWAELVEAGLAAVAVPEARGGAGLGFFESCLVLEQVGRTVAAVPLPGHCVGLMALRHAGRTRLSTSCSRARAGSRRARAPMPATACVRRTGGSRAR
ncbi:MAG: acyl-CoA dehydrogenase family protein [Gammaproteobacteria bacterium]|nr:acyl-CoA dehydrogenase family protein [Gammaproteobacteria bacterium]